MIMVVVGVIYIATYLPKHAPLALPTGLVIASTALFTANAVVLARLRLFAWDRFWQVARWALLAYLVIAGMLEYTFVYDHTRGSQLVLMSLMLGLFTANVPILLAFTVARFQKV